MREKKEKYNEIYIYIYIYVYFGFRAKHIKMAIGSSESRMNNFIANLHWKN